MVIWIDLSRFSKTSPLGGLLGTVCRCIEKSIGRARTDQPVHRINVGRIDRQCLLPHSSAAATLSGSLLARPLIASPIRTSSEASGRESRAAQEIVAGGGIVLPAECLLLPRREFFRVLGGRKCLQFQRPKSPAQQATTAPPKGGSQTLVSRRFAMGNCIDLRSVGVRGQRNSGRLRFGSLHRLPVRQTTFDLRQRIAKEVCHGAFDAAVSLITVFNSTLA